MKKLSVLVVCLAAASVGAGCDAILGLKRAELWVLGAGGGSGTSGTTGTGGTTLACAPGNSEACYTGPTGTEDAGTCKGGVATCGDAGQWGPCVGETTPQPRSCASTTTTDVACLGHDNCVAWADVLGSSGMTTASSIAVDAMGNSYVVGSFNGVIQSPKVTIAAGSAGAAYVLKLDHQGTPVWGRSFPAAMNAASHGDVVAVDTMGNVAIGGWAEAAVSFDSYGAGPGTFVTKLDASSGQVVWAQGLNANVTDVGDFIDDMAFTSLGDLVVGGRFTSELTLGDAPTSAPPGGHAYGFVGMLTSAHGLSSTASGGWARVLCSAATNTNPNCEVTGIRVVALDNILVAGDFQGELDLPSPLNPMVAKGTQDAFVAQLASAGGGLWEQQIGGTGATVTPFSLAADADGGSILAGDFSGTATLSQSPTVTMSSATPDSAFIVRYGPNQAHIWHEVLGCGQMFTSGSTCWVDGVVADSSGNVILAGTFNGSLSLWGSTPLVAPPNVLNFFVAKVSSAPAIVWAKSYDASGQRSDSLVNPYQENSETAGIAITPQGAPVVFGAASGPINVGWVALTPATGVKSYSFVAELAP